ncbi:sensor histidine kinase [Actinoplanes lutulentus]|nr:HAMP domain-containing sensor histidine kinase [Actinoplanes lutulentus]
MAELIQYSVALADLSASVGAQASLSADGFAAITAPINGSRLPGATEVAFVVPAAAGDVGAVQSEWRRRGSAALTLSPDQKSAGEHYFPVLARSLTGAAPSAADLTGTPDVVEALGEARDAGGVTTSSTYVAGDSGDRFFVMAAAVVASAPVAEVGAFRGWVTMTFRGRDFLGPAVGIIGGDQVSVRFVDTSGEVPVTVARWKPDVRLDGAMESWTVDFPAPVDQWRLVVLPTVGLLPATEAWLAPGAAAIGSVITVLLAALTATVVTSRDRALRRVDEATADLRDDILQREAVEQQLRRREEELVGFAGVVAHDLRSPLSNVVGYAEMIGLVDDDNLTSKQQGYLGKVRTSAGRMQELIDDLLAYATADNTTLRISEIDMVELVESIVAERRVSAPDATIDCEPLPSVQGDPSQIRQVLDNLIGNAIKYTPENQAATITITAADDAADPDLCRIDVADRGIGIPESQLAEVFNAFTRAEGSEHYPGTGLGLAIVQRIVERHNGTVGVTQNTGGGTRFWFTLPKTTASVRVPKNEPEEDL